jgi:hypothetical protein
MIDVVHRQVTIEISDTLVIVCFQKWLWELIWLGVPRSSFFRKTFHQKLVLIAREQTKGHR